MVAAFVSLYLISSVDAATTGFAQPPTIETASDGAAPRYQSQSVSRGSTRYVHSASLTELPDGRLRAFWYGGTREGAPDTAIFTSVFLPSAGRWDQERVAITRAGTQVALNRYIKKLGNPVVARDAQGRLWLFYVSVTLGGWSGSAINVSISDDDGETWGRPRRLITSPFLNLSTLVKGQAVFYKDGTIGLPVYHEFFGKFGELVRLNRQGEVVYKTRLSWGRSSLQPVVVPRNQLDAIGFMRYAGSGARRVLMFSTNDGGATWSRPRKTELPNPNAAVNSLRLVNGDVLLVFNNVTRGRDDLSLGHSADNGKTWRVLHTIERAPAGRAAGGEEMRFSYPCLIRSARGDYHLLYSWGNDYIKHVYFNRAWLDRVI